MYIYVNINSTYSYIFLMYVAWLLKSDNLFELTLAALNAFVKRALFFLLSSLSQSGEINEHTYSNTKTTKMGFIYC